MVDYRPQYTAIDNIERAYRARSQSNYQDSASTVGTTVTPPSSVGRSSYSDQSSSTGTTIDLPTTRPSYTDQIQFTGTTVSPPKPPPSYHKETKTVEETVEYPQHTHSVAQKSRMGYYDEDGKFYIKP